MNAPNIRFKGYTDEWKQKKLKNVIKEFYNGQTPYRQKETYWNGNINWLSSGDLNRGIITHTVEKITEEGRKSSGLKIIPKGTLVIAIMGLEAAGTRGNCGVLGIDTTINQACMALIIDEIKISSSFLFQWYKCFGNYYALKFTQGTKQQNYNADIIGNLDILYPSLKEQIGIGDLLSNLDNLITLHQRKCDEIKSIKKYMLQKMFPKQGEKVPEIRFPGFTGDWDQRKFNRVFNGLQNNTLSRSDLNYETGTIKNVHYGDVLIKFGDYINVAEENLPFITDDTIADKFERSFLRDGDIIIADTAEDDTVGKCTEIQGTEGIKLLAGLHTIPCRPKEKYGAKYLGYYINSSSYHTQLLPLMQGIKVTSISKSALQDTIIIAPKSLDEQTKIGAYFSNLDDLISLHQQEYEKYKELKKGLLQQMFI